VSRLDRPSIQHECPRNGCRRMVSQDQLACSSDWFLVPAKTRTAIWRAWDKGRGAGSPEHVVLIASAIEFLEGLAPK
jgi:hypothetical protein